jgi:opacity protein-like surface antigen
MSLNLAPFINFGNVETTSSNSSVPTGPYNQFGVEVGLTWQLRRRWSANLTYDYIRRESGASGASTSDNYIQNNVSLSLRYAF